MGSVDKDLEKTIDEQEKKTRIDFKMVTFSLANRDYGIDILKVKEISKARNFTIVPNTPAYVEGVYNLRGEIISIINLRKMFHLKELEKKGREDVDILILRLKDNVIGMIVDSVDNVVGIDSSTIQSRHPLFADINMKYISGVVEVKEKLYIILDVESVFGEGEEVPEEEEISPEQAEELEPAKKIQAASKTDLEFNFISETLETFIKFHISDINREWSLARMAEWRKIRKAQKKGVQLESLIDAEDFLTDFYSSYHGMLWGEDYKEQIEGLLKDTDKSALNVWCPNCGKGYDAYSITCLLRLHYPKQRIKVWASDNELLNISAAPNLILPMQSIPKYFIDAKFLHKIEEGYQFGKVVKDVIFFEYHDILHETLLPEIDIIVARDILSFYSPSIQEKIIDQFMEKLKPKGLLIIGTNERVKKSGLLELRSGNIIAYQKKKE
jgi:purine-binding chemotaxis protein CheW